MVTIEDIRKSSNKSGFKNVVSATAGPNGGGQGVRWRARKNYNPVTGEGKRGSARRTPETAAQDQCDYLNGLSATPATHRYPTPSVDMGTDTRHAPKVPTVRIERTEFKGPHDVYDVYFYDAHTGDVLRRKAGITARGEKRYSDIAKTFGFSIKPVKKAVTYPSKDAALAAENALIAEIASDTTNWRPVAKEAFAPRVPMNVKVLTS